MSIREVLVLDGAGARSRGGHNFQDEKLTGYAAGGKREADVIDVAVANGAHDVGWDDWPRRAVGQVGAPADPPRDVGSAPVPRERDFHRIRGVWLDLKGSAAGLVGVAGVGVFQHVGDAVIVRISEVCSLFEG